MLLNADNQFDGHCFCWMKLIILQTKPWSPDVGQTGALKIFSCFRSTDVGNVSLFNSVCICCHRPESASSNGGKCVSLQPRPTNAHRSFVYRWDVCASLLRTSAKSVLRVQCSSLFTLQNDVVRCQSLRSIRSILWGAYCKGYPTISRQLLCLGKYSSREFKSLTRGVITI